MLLRSALDDSLRECGLHHHVQREIENPPRHDYCIHVHLRGNCLLQLSHLHFEPLVGHLLLLVALLVLVYVWGTARLRQSKKYLVPI